MRIDVGAGIEEQTQFVDVRHRPHQRGGAGGIGHVRVGACREQLLHEAGIAIQGGEHQRSRSAGAPQSDDGGIAAQHPVGGRAIAVSNQRDQALGVTVDMKSRRDTREGVWPFGALVDPGFHDRDLIGGEWTRRRHLRTERRANQSVVQPAAIRVAGPDVRLPAASHRIGAPIEPEPVHLLIGTVTAVAVVAKDRLNVATEVHARGDLRGRPHQDDRRGDADGQHAARQLFCHRLLV